MQFDALSWWGVVVISGDITSNCVHNIALVPTMMTTFMLPQHHHHYQQSLAPYAFEDGGSV